MSFVDGSNIIIVDGQPAGADELYINTLTKGLEFVTEGTTYYLSRPMAIFRERLAANTEGEDLIGDTWIQRDVTLLHSDMSAAAAATGDDAGKMVLPAGVYMVESYAAAYFGTGVTASAYHSTRLYANSTPLADCSGWSAFDAPSPTELNIPHVQTFALGKITLSTSTTVALQSYLGKQGTTGTSANVAHDTAWVKWYKIG